MDDDVPGSGPAESTLPAAAAGADPGPNEPGHPRVTDRRAFMRSMSADTVANAGRFYGLGGVLRRSLDAAGGALVAELESLRARTDEATAPEATAPEATAPEATAPEATAPEATAPLDPAPGSTARDVVDAAREVPSARTGGAPAAAAAGSVSPGQPVSLPPRDHALTPDQEALVESAETLVIAVNRGSRGPQLTTSWFHWDGRCFRISSTRNGLRADLLRADPRVALLVENPASDETLIAEGLAELCEGPEVSVETRPILERYLAEDEIEAAWAELNATLDRIVIRVVPDRLLFTRTEGLLGRPARRTRQA